MFTKVNKKHPLVQGRCGCAGIAGLPLSLRVMRENTAIIIAKI